MFTRRGFLKLAAKIWLTGLGILGYATGIEAMGTPRVTTYALSPPGWTPGLRLKIVLLADFHACEPWMSPKRIGEICDQANLLGGDMILLLGDYRTSMKFITDTIDPREIAARLARLNAPLGVHSILGNHDYWADDAYQADPTRKTLMEEVLEEAGIPVYVNRSIRLEKQGIPFWLSGLGDQIARMRTDESGRTTVLGIENMADTLAQVTDEAPVILMAHEPYVFSNMPRRFSVTLSGHTHGGQVKIFGWAPLVGDRPDKDYLGGHFIRDGKHIIVSRGLGCSGIPVRLGAWPEICVVELG